MFKLIEKLRKKPESKRQGIVLAVAFSVTFVIAVFWLIALVIKIRNGGVSLDTSIIKNEGIQRSAEEIKNSWNSFTDSLNGVIKDINPQSSEPASVVTTTTTATIPE